VDKHAAATGHRLAITRREERREQPPENIDMYKQQRSNRTPLNFYVSRYARAALTVEQWGERPTHGDMGTDRRPPLQFADRSELILSWSV